VRRLIGIWNLKAKRKLRALGKKRGPWKELEG